MTDRPPAPFWLLGSVWLSVAGLVAGLAVAAEKTQPVSAAKSPALRVNPGEDPAVARFHRIVEPILQEHCYDCHGDGAKKGGLAFDDLDSKQKILNPEVWLKVLKNTRSHIMPPPDAPQPTAAQRVALENWIIKDAFALDPKQDDPGRVTVRRMNRAEYRNTIRDLLGVEFDTEHALAADDIGYGFDNISDVLTLSPIRMEKFIEAAQHVVKKGVPGDFQAITETMALGPDFKSADGTKTGDPMTFYREAAVAKTFPVPVSGDYRIVMASSVDGRTNPDPGRCKVTVFADGKEIHSKIYTWSDCMFFLEERTLRLEAGDRKIEYRLEPLEPPEKQKDKMDFKIVTVQVIGPLERKDWLPAPHYDRYFSRPRAPEGAAARRAYATEVIGKFAAKAYRQPPTPDLVERLVQIAENVYGSPDATFEAGIQRAFVAILASPRFLFRFEELEAPAPGALAANVDEYALASRLSFFLWSSTPDDELLKLAAAKSLRKNLTAQVRRMLADPKADALVENFAGQWLLTKEILNVALNRPAVLEREGVKLAPPRRFGGPAMPVDVTLEQRQALKREAEAYFDHVARNNRNVLELIESDYTFTNETLAKYYGLPAEQAAKITGPELRKLDLAPDDPRGGGVITMASTLAVTSNPTRTSPVKRGKWILENILGAPPAPPPPDIPSLEDTQKRIPDRTPTQRELLAIHREEALCASCHSRMDPLGLALENFNALGLYRTQELNQPVDASGELATGEKFKTIRDLKRIFVTDRRKEVYHTLAEKLLTYALGRGLDYYDVPTLDKIVVRLEQNDGRFFELLMGVIESAPFQKARITTAATAAEAKPAATGTRTE